MSPSILEIQQTHQIPEQRLLDGPVNVGTGSESGGGIDLKQPRVQRLVDEGAAVAIKDGHGYTPLHKAANYGHARAAAVAAPLHV